MSTTKPKIKVPPAPPQKAALELAYHLSRSPAVQRAREHYDRNRRLDILTDLAKSTGAIVDEVVDVDLGSAYTVMQERKAQGFQWVPSLLMNPVAAPTFLPGPAGSIKVSANLSDYKPIKPARKFAQQQFFDTKNWLDANGFFTGNPPQMMILNKDAEDAKTEDLFAPVGPLAAEKVQFAGAIPHYGIVVNTTGKIFDAEELSLLIVQGAQAVADYLGMDVPEIMPAEPDPAPLTAGVIDDVVGALDPQHPGTRFGATYDDWKSGRTYPAPDGNSYTGISFGSPPFAEYRWQTVIPPLVPV